MDWGLPLLFECFPSKLSQKLPSKKAPIFLKARNWKSFSPFSEGKREGKGEG
jgi:hypothetical protein